MTLLTIVQNAADETQGPRPGSVAGNADPAAQTYLRLLNSAGTHLMKTVAWQTLRKEQTFTAVAGSEQTGALPNDFDRFVPETFWDRTNRVLVSGPQTPTRWQAMQAGGYNDHYPRFIYRGGSVFVSPDASGGESMAFEYVSNQWCQDSGSTGQTAFAADTDTGILDEELLTLALIYRYTVSEGMETAMVARENFERHLNTLIKNDQPKARIMVAADIFGGGRHFTGEPPAQGASSDITVL